MNDHARGEHHEEGWAVDLGRRSTMRFFKEIEDIMKVFMIGVHSGECAKDKVCDIPLWRPNNKRRTLPWRDMVARFKSIKEYVDYATSFYMYTCQRPLGRGAKDCNWHTGTYYSDEAALLSHGFQEKLHNDPEWRHALAHTWQGPVVFLRRHDDTSLREWKKHGATDQAGYGVLTSVALGICERVDL